MTTPPTCIDDKHFSRAPMGTGEPNHEYMEERDHVVRGKGSTALALCYYCRIHHVAKIGG